VFLLGVILQRARYAKQRWGLVVGYYASLVTLIGLANIVAPFACVFYVVLIVGGAIVVLLPSASIPRVAARGCSRLTALQWALADRCNQASGGECDVVEGGHGRLDGQADP